MNGLTTEVGNLPILTKAAISSEFRNGLYTQKMRPKTGGGLTPAFLACGEVRKNKLWLRA
jgi:hypothetical protein